MAPSPFLPRLLRKASGFEGFAPALVVVDLDLLPQDPDSVITNCETKTRARFP
jgi:hypothetical protein